MILKILKNNKYFILYLLFVVLILSQLGFNFPVPWEDESAFVFQAISFSQTGSLFTNILSDSKIIMWIQPGYMILQAFFYKLFGFSFELARFISWIFYLSSIVLFYKIIKNFFNEKLIFLSLLIFVLPSGLAIANVARMDGLILLILLSCVYFLFKKNYITTLSFMILGILIHFNIVYFSIVLVSTMALDFSKFRSVRFLFTKNKYDYIFLILSILMFLAYLLFIYFNLVDYKNDMAFQFARKLNRTPFYFDIQNIIILIVMFSVSFYFFIIKHRNFVILSSTGFSLFLLYANGQEMWYIFFLYLSICFFFVLFIAFFKNKYIKYSLSVIFILTILIKLFVGDFVGMNLRYYDTNYLDTKTKNNICNKIIELKEKNNIENMSIYINNGNDLFFYNFAKRNNIYLVHLLPKEISKYRDVDIAVYIHREKDPSWLKSFKKKISYRVAKIVSNKNREVKITLYEKN